MDLACASSCVVFTSQVSLSVINIHVLRKQFCLTAEHQNARGAHTPQIHRACIPKISLYVHTVSLCPRTPVRLRVVSCALYLCGTLWVRGRVESSGAGRYVLAWGLNIACLSRIRFSSIHTDTPRSSTLFYALLRSSGIMWNALVLRLQRSDRGSTATKG